MDNLMTKQEVKKYLGIRSDEKYREFIQAGMPHIYVGARRRFVKEEVLKWFKEQQKEE